jgi:hypothetical protein
MHIITYATHEERYLPLLKQSCPDLVILGMGKKWNGFQDKVWATVEYCKQHPHEIICFIDGFDSVVLHDELLARYETFDSPLVMSHAGLTQTVFSKYIQDKMFGKCKEERLNSGMFIGTSESIITFWEDFQGGDDQQYATQTCKTMDMKIDTEHLLFYNYSPTDTIVVKQGQLYVNDAQPCVISCPAGGDINPYLTQLGYTPPEIHYNWTYRLRTYMKTFLPEVLLIFAIVTTFACVSFPLSLAIAFLMFSTFVEYELHIKHYSVSPWNAFCYLSLDCLHVFIVIVVFYLLFNLQCSMKKLVLLNTIYLIIVVLFYYFKRCIITIYQNHFIQDDVGWPGPFDRILYFFNPEKQYVTKHKSKDFTNRWIEGNKKTVALIIALNLYCLYKMHKN